MPKRRARKGKGGSSARWAVLCSAYLAASAAVAQPQPPAPVNDAAVDAAVDAADALLGTLGEEPGPIERMAGYDRRASLERAFDDPARENWTYWPTQREGLALEHMTARQRTLTHELLRTALSSTGYSKVFNIMQLESILKELDEGGFPRDVGHYTLALFGDPSGTAPWGWRLEGHHVSLNVTVARDAMSVTPSFLGANPGEVRHGPMAGFRALGAEEDLGRELVRSLSPQQRAQAVLSGDPPRDILSGNLGRPREQWDEWRTALEPDGIPVAGLNEVQRHWVGRILDEVVSAYRPEISSRYLERIDVGELSFAWIGGTERGEPYYYRLQGPDFVFELDNVQNDGNHVHSVWRSRSSDFGARLLERHYRAHHR